MTPEKLLLDIMQEEWDSSNSFGLTPKISFGWFNEDDEMPQLTISQPDETPSNGGETGFSGMSPDGPTQRIVGTIQANIWSRPSDLSGADTSAPRQYNSQATEEMQRIISLYNDQPTNPRTGERPVNYLSYGGKTPVPEPDDTIPMLHHYNVTVNYGYGPTTQ